MSPLLAGKVQSSDLGVVSMKPSAVVLIFSLLVNSVVSAPIPEEPNQPIQYCIERPKERRETKLNATKAAPQPMPEYKREWYEWSDTVTQSIFGEEDPGDNVAILGIGGVSFGLSRYFGKDLYHRLFMMGYEARKESNRINSDNEAIEDRLNQRVLTKEQKEILNSRWSEIDSKLTDLAKTPGNEKKISDLEFQKIVIEDILAKKELTDENRQALKLRLSDNQKELTRLNKPASICKTMLALLGAGGFGAATVYSGWHAGLNMHRTGTVNPLEWKNEQVVKYKEALREKVEKDKLAKEVADFEAAGKPIADKIAKSLISMQTALSKALCNKDNKHPEKPHDHLGKMRGPEPYHAGLDEDFREFEEIEDFSKKVLASMLDVIKKNDGPPHLIDLAVADGKAPADLLKLLYSERNTKAGQRVFREFIDRVTVKTLKNVMTETFRSKEEMVYKLDKMKNWINTTVDIVQKNLN